MHNNQQGFSVIEGLMIVVIVALISFVGWFVWQAKNNTNKSFDSAVNAQITTKTTFTKKSAPPATQTPVTPATPTTTSTTTSTTKSSSSTKSQPASPTPVTPTPTPPTSVASTVTISSDGCDVTATGGPGYTLSVWVYQGGHGGLPTYTIPASGTLSVYTGGMQGYTVDASVLNGNTQLADQVTTITAVSCPPAGTY